VPLAVRVPASTSNLGPGFDALGVALSLTLEVRLYGPLGESGEHLVEVAAAPPGGWPAPGEDLLLEAFDRARERRGAPKLPHHFEVRSDIPIARGLGSSAAAIVAGLLLGAESAEPGATRDSRALLPEALALEGHPDNVTPALLGGGALCLPRAGSAPLVLAAPVHESIEVGLAWPDETVPTARARAVLPATVAFADAVENARRLPFLLRGLARGDRELLAEGGEDRLHERHRLPLVAGGTDALAAAHTAGAWLATVSGSGSALIALCGRGGAQACADAMAAALRAAGGSGTARVTAVAREAPRVRTVQGAS
jgi:homoserine kinase